MIKTTYHLPIKTPEGEFKLKTEHTVVHEDDDEIEVTISTFVNGKVYFYKTETTEEALISLAKDLPFGWNIKSCISCRYGQFCPVGNSDNELFCVTDFEPKEPSDLWHVTEDDIERNKRCRTLFDSCEKHEEQSDGYFTYSDYRFKMREA